MKSKSVNFPVSNAKCSVKFARSVNENTLHAVLLIITIECLLFERITNDLVNDIQVYSLFVAFIR